MQVQVKRGTRGARGVPLRGFPPLAVTVLVPVAFVALKLGSVVDWSWGWVVAPIWIPALLTLIIVALAAAAFTLFRWLLMARAWLRLRQATAPELFLADPAILSRIEAERPFGTPETTDA